MKIKWGDVHFKNEEIRKKKKTLDWFKKKFVKIIEKKNLNLEVWQTDDFVFLKIGFKDGSSEEKSKIFIEVKLIVPDLRTAQIRELMREWLPAEISVFDKQYLKFAIAIGRAYEKKYNRAEIIKQY